MKTRRFMNWLNAHYGDTAKGRKKAADILADCQRVEAVLGDLDVAHDNAEYHRIMRALRYSASDERNRAMPPPGFQFTHDEADPVFYKSVREVMSSLRSSVNRYWDLRDGIDPARPIVNRKRI